jgi:hypothetical protein
LHRSGDNHRRCGGGTASPGSKFRLTDQRLQSRGNFELQILSFHEYWARITKHAFECKKIPAVTSYRLAAKALGLAGCHPNCVNPSRPLWARSEKMNHWLQPRRREKAASRMPEVEAVVSARKNGCTSAAPKNTRTTTTKGWSKAGGITLQFPNWAAV